MASMSGPKYTMVSRWSNKTPCKGRITSTNQSTPIPLGKIILLTYGYIQSLMWAWCVTLYLMFSQTMKQKIQYVCTYISLNIFSGSTFSKPYILGAFENRKTQVLVMIYFHTITLSILLINPYIYSNDHWPWDYHSQLVFYQYLLYNCFASLSFSLSCNYSTTYVTLSTSSKSDTCSLPETHQSCTVESRATHSTNECMAWTFS